MQRNGVVHRTGNFSVGQAFLHPIPPVLGQQQGELVIDVASNAVLMRQLHKVMTAQALPVGVCNLSALGVEGFKMCQLDAQDGGLDFVQAAVVAHHFVIVAIHAPPIFAVSWRTTAGPWSASRRMASASRLLLVVISPPSPQAPRFLLVKKLKAPARLMLPVCRPSMAAPKLWAQSSTRIRS